MKRQFPGLHAEPSRANDVVEGIFLVTSGPSLLSLAPAKAFLRSQLRYPRAEGSSPTQNLGTIVLHPQIALEVELVSAGFRL